MERGGGGEDEAAAVEAGGVGGLEPEFLGSGGGGGGDVRGVWRERGVGVCGGGGRVGHDSGISDHWERWSGGADSQHRELVVSLYRNMAFPGPRAFTPCGSE